MIKNLNFNKDIESRWYVDLPDWDGPEKDLEMVLGADTMLDILSQGESFVNISISTSDFRGRRHTLFQKEEEGGGFWYRLETEFGTEFPVWLCYVTKYVFGEFPSVLYVG